MTIFGLIVLVVLAFAGIPLYLAIMIAAVIMLVAGVGIDPTVAMTVTFEKLNSVLLFAIPLFVLMGQILAVGGAGKPLVRVLNAFMGHIPGGPAYALIVGNMMLAAMCSTSIAGIAAFGPLMIPMMKELGYSEKFSIGLLIASSTLAPLMPPSIITIIYSFISSASGEPPISVLTLWTASIIPACLLALLLCVTVFIHSRRGHFQRLPSATWAERWGALKEGWAIGLMPAVVLGPLYAGWVNPNETAVIGTVYVTLISAVIYRGLTLRNFWQSCVMTARMMGMIFVIIMVAMLLIVAIVYARVPFDLAEWLADLGLNWWCFLGVVMLFYVVMGMFLDPNAIMLVTVPILLKSVGSVGISIVAFGIFTTLAINIANISPPYGMTIFASMGIMGKPYSLIVKSTLLFFPALIIGLILVAFIPELSTWLPEITGR